MLDLSPETVIPSDAKFEEAPILPQDPVAPSKSSDSMRVDGDAAQGDMVEYLKFDETENKIIHELVQDVEPILEDAKRLARETDGKNKAKDFYHAARVAPVVLHAWLNAKGLKMSDFKGQIIKDFLNDPDNSAFRIWPGRV